MPLDLGAMEATRSHPDAKRRAWRSALTAAVMRQLELKEPRRVKPRQGHLNQVTSHGHLGDDLVLAPVADSLILLAHTMSLIGRASVKDMENQKWWRRSSSTRANILSASSILCSSEAAAPSAAPNAASTSSWPVMADT